MIYDVYRRPSKRPPTWLMNVGAVVVGVIGTVIVAAWEISRAALVSSTDRS